MRHFLLLVLVGVCLAVTAAPTAGSQVPGRYVAARGTVELCNGVGVAGVVARGGSIVGQIDRGRVRIRDLPDGAGTDINVWGVEWRRVIDARTTVYGGAGLRFRALGGAWRVRLKGRDIDASAAGRGQVTLRGTAGTFAVDADGCEREWPEEATTFQFGD